MKDFLYLDYNATTPADLRVIEAMMPFFAEIYGNAGSSHLFGLTVKEAVEQAGDQIASLISSKPKGYYLHIRRYRSHKSGSERHTKNGR